MSDLIKLNQYINGAVDGHNYVFCFDFLKAVQYPKGKRDILVFICLNHDMKTPMLKSNGDFRFCGIVMNSCDGKSGKAKINKVKRYLLKKEDGLTLLDSFRHLPPIDYFLREVPYAVNVDNRTVGKNTVSNITHISSSLYGKQMPVKQKFDGEK